MKPPSIPHLTAALSLAAALQGTAYAEKSASDISDASLLPVAISVALPIVLVAGTGSIIVTGVQASAEGTVWLVENVSDGVKGSIRFTGRAIEGSAVAVGAVITVTAIATGWILSEAGHAVAFIPNEIGRSLSYNQKVSQ